MTANDNAIINSLVEQQFLQNLVVFLSTAGSRCCFAHLCMKSAGPFLVDITRIVLLSVDTLVNFPILVN